MRRVQSAQPNLEFTYEDMFKVATRQTSAFGIEGYEAPKKYADPLQQIEERKFREQKKGQKNRNYVTKRGHYLEDLKKQTDAVPAPNKYDLIKKWADPKASQRAKSAPSKRNTFIDEIFKEAKLRGVPGSGKYNVVKPLEEVLKQVQEQKKKKISASERPTYLNEIMHLAVINPGPGNYNPRPISKKVKPEHRKQTDFIARHAEQDKKRGKSALPDVGSYNPEPLSFTTFNKLGGKKKTEKQNQNYFGKDDRFKDPKKTKSKLLPVPGPGQYPLVVEWQGKVKDKSQTRKRNYLQFMTKGTHESRSIYY